MFAREQMWVPHICPVLADVGKAEGPVSNRWSPVSFFPITSAVHDVRKAVPASHLAESPSNSAVSVTNAAVSQLTSPQSSKPNSAEIESDSAASVSNSAESDLIEARAVNCCRARQHCETPMQSITEPQRGGGWGVGGGPPPGKRVPGSLFTPATTARSLDAQNVSGFKMQTAFPG
jgi:hypothetical protein